MKMKNQNVKGLKGSILLWFSFFLLLFTFLLKWISNWKDKMRVCVLLKLLFLLFTVFCFNIFVVLFFSLSFDWIGFCAHMLLCCVIFKQKKSKNKRVKSLIQFIRCMLLFCLVWFYFISIAECILVLLWIFLGFICFFLLLYNCRVYFVYLIY